MLTLQVRGHITDEGQLVVDLPEGLPAGDVNVTLEISDIQEDSWTDAEIARWMESKPATSGAEAAERLATLNTSEWMTIDDPIAWVEDVQRRMWKSL